jgi:hypothetical protein
LLSKIGLGLYFISKKVRPAGLAQNPGPFGLGPGPDPALLCLQLVSGALIKPDFDKRKVEVSEKKNC